MVTGGFVANRNLLMLPGVAHHNTCIQAFGFLSVGKTFFLVKVLEISKVAGILLAIFIIDELY